MSQINEQDMGDTIVWSAPNWKPEPVELTWDKRTGRFMACWSGRNLVPWHPDHEPATSPDAARARACGFFGVESIA